MADLSILNSVKKNLGLEADYDVYDPDVIMYINGVFSTLNQLGVGPEIGFTIEDDSATWGSFIGTNKRYSFVQTYVSLRARLLFDPPTTSYLIEAMNKQIAEFEFRINLLRESTEWVNPNTVIDDSEDQVIDGGEA